VSANLALQLVNREQNLAIVREAVLGFAAALALDALATDDLDTAVLEACKNVVWHAYDGTEGPLELELHALEDAVQAVVRDRGIGIRPHIGEHREHHTGIGLPLIHVRARRVSYTNLSSGGTELRIGFELEGVQALEPLDAAHEPGQLAGWGGGEDGRIWLALSPHALAGAVLPRTLRALWRVAELPAGGSEVLAPLSEALVRAGAAGGLALSAQGVEGALVIRALGIDERGQRELRDWIEAGRGEAEPRDRGELELRLRARE
jgi:anti-sigma regulatory factor (Ser/Thr protein kinase)